MAFPFVSWSVLSLVFALSGPFGSYEALGFPRRLVLWGAVTAVATLLAMVLRGALRRHPDLSETRRTVFLTAFCTALILSWPLQALTNQISAPTTHPALFEVAVFIFATSLATGAFYASFDPPQSQQGEPNPAAEAEDPAPLHPRIVQRLDPGMQGRLISMTVRDHYVDVITTAGRGSVLIRFADAMVEAEDEPGAQVHRSHWVAWWAVERAEKAGGKVLLHLQGAAPVPVSRTYRPTVEARGLV
ncbi:LytTR family DNA-binding domain-containing protein [Gemmobacter aquatilis]|uniref:LytTR family DNA-binding domain-containing protein n=1 Tax=Gemmobacter aquatilis TaxID=933059 RepID=UPI001C31EA20|nr:LytTR family DNA-binding domain-containing protein [Gemmobacter aquatilis]